MADRPARDMKLSMPDGGAQDPGDGSSVTYDVQRMLSMALGVTAVVFRTVHLNNSPRPDWRHVGVATIKGPFYDRAYLKTRAVADAMLAVHLDICSATSEFSHPPDCTTIGGCR